MVDHIGLPIWSILTHALLLFVIKKRFFVSTRWLYCNGKELFWYQVQFWYCPRAKQLTRDFCRSQHCKTGLPEISLRLMKQNQLVLFCIDELSFSTKLTYVTNNMNNFFHSMFFHLCCDKLVLWQIYIFAQLQNKIKGHSSRTQEPNKSIWKEWLLHF